MNKQAKDQVIEAALEAAGDPEGYVGPDGKAAPHEQPWEVVERDEDVLDHFKTVPLTEVADQESEESEDTYVDESPSLSHLDSEVSDAATA